MSTPAAPASLKLYYFDFDGGRGEPTRVAFSIGEIPFEDIRVVFADWGALRPTTPFGGLPVLEVDGVRVSQSNAINRYAGRLSGLYPQDPLQALYCDEVSDTVEWLYAHMLSSNGVKDPDEMKRLRLALLESALPQHLKGLGAMLERGGGEWFAGGQLSVADLKVTEIVRQLGAGRLDHIPVDIVEQTAPSLVAHRARVLAHPGVAAYYAKRSS